MPFLEKRLLFPLQTTLTIAAFLRGNNFNQSWCILRYHPAVLQPKTRWRWEKTIPSWLGIIMNLGEWNNLWSNCCSALKRCHPYNRNEWNQISPSSKFLKYIWMVVWSVFSYDPLGCISVPRAKSVNGIKGVEMTTDCSVNYLKSYCDFGIHPQPTIPPKNLWEKGWR